MKDVFDKDYPTKRPDAPGECETTAPYADGGAYRTPKEVGAVYPHLVKTYGQQVVDEVFIPKFEEMLQVTIILPSDQKNNKSSTFFERISYKRGGHIYVFGWVLTTFCGASI